MGPPTSTGCALTATIRGPGCPSSDGCARPRPGRRRAAWCRFEWPCQYLQCSELEPEDLVDEGNVDAPGDRLMVDDQSLVHRAVHAVRHLRAGILERKGVLVDSSKALLEVGHDLLCPHDQDDPPGTAHIRTELAASGRDGDQRSGLRDGVDAAKHHVRRAGKPPDLLALGLSVPPQNPPPRIPAPPDLFTPSPAAFTL